ncbi:MAG: hypothetical protein DRJ69_01640, partial [Thermoprotei archaeon]
MQGDQHAKESVTRLLGLLYEWQMDILRDLESKCIRVITLLSLIISITPLSIFLQKAVIPAILLIIIVIFYVVVPLVVVYALIILRPTEVYYVYLERDVKTLGDYSWLVDSVHDALLENLKGLDIEIKRRNKLLKRLYLTAALLVSIISIVILYV